MLPDSEFLHPKSSFETPAPLPTTDPDEGDLVCVSLARSWLPLVRGALLQLLQKATWDTTDPDDLNLAQSRADMLIDLFNDEAVCAMFDVRIDPENDCMLQKTVDGGVNWTTVGSFYQCAKGAAADEIADEIADGTLGTRGQQPPGGTLLPLECHTYHVSLRGNDRWLCPVPVSVGFTVYVTNLEGGWYDGNVVGVWRCPTGEIFLLGYCQTGSKSFDGSDPCTTAYHAVLVGEVAGVWFDTTAGTYTVPAPLINQPLFLQMNDLSLGDNQGSIQFDVTVCNMAACPALSYDWTVLTDILPWRIMNLPEGNLNYRNDLQDQAANAIFAITQGQGLIGYGYQVGHYPVCGVLELGKVCTLTDVKLWQAGGDCRVSVRQQGTWNTKAYVGGGQNVDIPITGGENTDAIGFEHYAAGQFTVQKYELYFA